MNKLEELIQKLCPNGVEYRPLGELCEIRKGKQLNKDGLLEQGNYPVINGGINPSGYWNEYNFEKDLITISQGGASAGYVNFITTKFWAGAHCYVLVNPKNCLNYRLLYHIVKNYEKELMSAQVGAGIPSVSSNKLTSLSIPVPPIEVQEEIVRILDKFTELSARKKQYEFYRDEQLRKSDAQIVTLKDICTNYDAKRRPITKNKRVSGLYPYYGASGIVDYVKDFIFDDDYLLVSEDGANLLSRVTPIAFSISGKTWVNNHAHILKFQNYITQRYVEIYLNSIDLAKYISTAAQPKLTQENLNKIEIPLPPLEEQNRIVAILDRFDKICNDISEGLPAEIEARQKQYEYYRDKLLTFEEIAQ